MAIYAAVALGAGRCCSSGETAERGWSRGPPGTGPDPPRTGRTGQASARLIGREPFQKRSWAELGFFIASSALAGAAALVLAALGVAGVLLAVVLVGTLVLAGGLRAARGFGRWQRGMARVMLGAEIPEPERSALAPVCSPGCVHPSGPLRLAGGGYFIAKVPLTVFGVWFALSVWLRRSWASLLLS